MNLETLKGGESILTHESRTKVKLFTPIHNS